MYMYMYCSLSMLCKLLTYFQDLLFGHNRWHSHTAGVDKVYVLQIRKKKCFWSPTKTLRIISVIIVHSKSNNHADNPIYWSCVLRCSSKIIHCDHWNEIWFAGILLWLLFKIFCLGFIYTVSQRKLTFIIRLFNTPGGYKLTLVHLWTVLYCNCFVSLIYND